MWDMLIGGGAAAPAEVVTAPAVAQAPDHNDMWRRELVEQRRAQWNEDGSFDSDATMEVEDPSEKQACSPAPTEPDSPVDARAYVMRARQAQLQAEERARQAEERARQAEERARQAEARALAAEASLREARAELECVVCLSRRKTMLMVPCNHLCTCAECAVRLMNAPCPICRGVVVYTIRVHL